MLDFADRLGCDRLATGHYARIAEPDHPDGPVLQRAVDQDKDQTYMLAALEPSSLGRMSFPLGALTKPDVRRIAAEAGLPVAGKRDSMDLCFLAGTDRGRFLARHGGVRARQGEIVDAGGSVLGRHRGQHLFTVGQRRGLGVDGREPLYVLDKRAVDNRVVVGPRRALRTTRVPITDLRLHRAASRVDHVKLRYRSAPLPAKISGPGADEIELAEPVEGAAPGQLACLLDGNLVVGWATIARRS
jgi:tRNA-specific 2-thiouridylase